MMETLEDRRVLAPGFSFVDANNDHLFDAGTDVALVGGEVEDGLFDTLVPEGGYVRVIPGAGLVVNGGPISARNVTYRAQGDVVINADLDADLDIRLTSRQQSVVLDDPVLTAGDDVLLWAGQDIVSHVDAIRGVGDASLIRLWAGRDVLLQETEVIATGDRSDVYIIARRDANVHTCLVEAGRDARISAGRDLDVVDSTVFAGRNVTVRALGNAMVTGSTLDAGNTATVWSLGNVDARNSGMYADTTVSVWAGRDIAASGSVMRADRTVAVRSNGDVDVTDAMIDAGWNITLWSRRMVLAPAASLTASWRVALWGNWRVDVNGASLAADREVEVRSAKGKVFAMDAYLSSLGSPNGEVDLDAGLDIVAKRSYMEASRAISLAARDDVFAKQAMLATRGNRGRIELRAAQKVSVWDATVRAFEKIGMWSDFGDLDARRASIAISYGSTNGDVALRADEILVQGAEILSPDELQLTGTVVGTPDFIGEGTEPFFFTKGPGSGTSVAEFHGPFDFYERSSGTVYGPPYVPHDGQRPDQSTWYGQKGYYGTMISVDTENATQVWSEDGRSFQLNGNGTPFGVVVCHPRIAAALFDSPMDSAQTHTVELRCGEVSCVVVSINGNTYISGLSVQRFCTAYRAY